jgi:hypothetical protein
MRVTVDIGALGSPLRGIPRIKSRKPPQLQPLIRGVLKDSFGLAALALIAVIWWLTVSAAPDDGLVQALDSEARAP